MTDVKVNAYDIDGALERIIQDFNENAGKDVERAVKAAAKQCSEDLRSTSPVKSGRYASGWRYRMKEGSSFGYEATVYNAKSPGLTHLLEKGHEMFIDGKDTGKRVPAHPHIAPAADAAMETMMRELTRYG